MIKPILNTLLNADRQQVPSLLQEMNSLIIKHYHLRIDDLIINPKEVESYYYHSTQFPDPYVHKNELQSDRFGKIYFHRKGFGDKSPIIGLNRGGMDICLSDSNDYYYGILIRMAQVVNNNDLKYIYGPALLKNYVINHINTLIGGIDLRETSEFEANNIVLAINDDPLNHIVYHLPRIGLTETKGSHYYKFPLRSITDIRLSKDQKKYAVWYMLDKNVEATMENVYGLLGYHSTPVLNEVRARRANYLSHK